MKLKDRIALVTGAARGIGLATVKRFRDEGATVIMADINADRLDRAKAEIEGGERLTTIRCDVSCHADVDAMIRQSERIYGRIDIVASIAGKEGNANMIPCSTAKAGLIGLTKALAKEVGGDGIYVKAISPAVIHTPILDQVTPEQVNQMLQRIPLGRAGRPEEVAALICWLASDEATFTTGQCVDISGGRATY
jgi:NAD(P)-dependent dehydrogenase (short-subunit alcohol dehydrogenase family)